MATYITHIALADKVFSKHFQKFEKKDFYIGCVFPDIRYLGVIERGQTHVHNVTLHDVVDAPTSFSAGVLYHSLVDEVRERFVVSRRIYDLCPKSPHIATAIKLYEDELYYPYIKNWGSICTMFDSILPEELAYNISREAIEQWHKMGIAYCQQSPTPKSVEVFTLGARHGQAVADEINALLLQIKNIPEVREIAMNFWNQFDDILVNGS